MPPPEHLLSVTSTSEGGTVTIHADRNEPSSVNRSRDDALLTPLFT